MHLTPQHWILALPTLALVTTPLFPFNSGPSSLLGIPIIVLWVAFWAVFTTLVLAFLYRTEPELGDGLSTTERSTP
ncbi:hypothetical protein CKALI_03245 [Corynebacterium kalinowskii]|uniref:DUF3311 domain-containing protein n=1 Tax=Corynebacterium kalinowskii TaxID=2675216 RepID=A0A6B8V8Z0_9CORY|nr:hypothetical protein CKALI_03245 [Corynebacterium kalinowskii]